MDSVEIELKPVKADAELMSAWLGGMEDVSISPKLLFDLQTLLRHYADFLVPNKDISVDYQYEGTPCASVDKNQVFIPLDMLKDGRVDETISAVIHELHHIKFSDKETDTCRNIMPFFERILNTVEIEHYGKKMSIWTALKSHGNIVADDIIERKMEHPYKEFVYQYFGDLFLLLNAIEDVRIDEMQPPNLLKYRYKQEEIAFAKFKEAYAEGTMDKDSLFGSFIDALFHLKGMGKSDIIENSNITKDRIVAVDSPTQYYPPVFSAFAKVLQTHGGSLWQQYEDQQNMNDSAISDFLVEEAIGDEDGGNKVDGDKELGLSPKKSSDCPQLDGNLADDVRNTFGESDIQDLLQAMSPQGDEQGGKQQVLMNPQLWAEVQAFKSLQHIPCHEPTKHVPQGINYDTLILDCYA